MDAENTRFLRSFSDLSDANKPYHPIARWVEERAELDPRAVVPIRYLEPDWLDFWRTYKDGLYREAATTVTWAQGKLPRTIRQWAAPQELRAIGSLRGINCLPIRHTNVVDKESGRMEYSLRGIKLKNRGRILGEPIGLGDKVKDEAFDNKYKSKTELREERRARREERRTEDLAIKRAIQSGVSLDQALAALQHMSAKDMDVSKLYDWVTKGYPALLRSRDPIFG